MKFMKLGSKPDALQVQADGNTVRHVASELSSDFVVVINDFRFYLHKFPLLSKSDLLQKLLKSNEKISDSIDLSNIPGGLRAFEICAKFCYGMSVTLNAYNVIAARCAGEFLEMTEDVERGNLIFKIEVFLNSSIFRSWKDSIIALQSTPSVLPWSEDLKLVSRCVDSISSKCAVGPASVTWSYTLKEREIEAGTKLSSVPKEWWIEDITELEIDMYKGVMNSVKSKREIHGELIGEALKSYAIRWLPESVEALRRKKVLIQEIILLLPDRGCSCSFLLKLLGVSVVIGIDESVKDELVSKIGVELYDASVNDLLIPANSPQITVYDIELVQSILEQFQRAEEFIPTNSMDSDEFVRHGSSLKVAKLIDGFLAEIAHDPNLSIPSFINLSQCSPDSSRPVHDGLYKAIDIYLQEHPSLTKSERKNICSLINVKKLTIDASIHAAQNERLPLRVVVQVLFFEQIRSASIGVRTINSTNTSQSTTNTEESEKNYAAESCRSLEREMNRLKIRNDENKMMITKSKSRRGAAQLLQSRSRRIIEKLWPIGKVHIENRTSETSAGSQSRTPTIAKSSSKNRRHSVS